MPIRFLLVDDHPIVLEALKSALAIEFPAVEIREATSLAGAVVELGSRRSWDLVVLDLALPDVRGLDGLIQLRRRFPRVPVLVFSAMTDGRIVRPAIAAGALGFLPKTAGRAEIKTAIRNVLDGRVYLPTGLVEDTEESIGRRVGSLTRQQLRVLQAIRQGKLNKQIAFELGVGETTVKAHVSEILRKLGVSSRTQVVIEVAALDFDHLLGDTAER